MVRRAILFLVCIPLLSSASDLKYSRKTTDSTGEHGEITLYYQGQRTRIDHRNEVGFGWKNGRPETVAYGPRMATIYQCDMHRVLQLDFEHHQYTVTELDSDGLPADARPATGLRKSGAKVRVVVESRDTGEIRQVFGTTARRFITTRRTVPGPGACSKPSEITEDGWYIDIPPAAESCADRKMSPHSNGAVLVAGDNSCGMDDYEVQHSGPTPPPFAVEVTSTHNGDSSHAVTTAVTELSRLPLDPQIFDLPTGYKHVDKLDDSPNLPWLLRGKLMWQSVKTTVWGWTPWGK